MYHKTLLDAPTLASLLQDDVPPRVLDCRLRLDDPEAGRRLYLEGHIPGALHADLDRALAGPVTGTTGRHPLPDRAGLAEAVGRLGIAPGAQVVAYDDQGGAMAARLWWLLRWLGHEPVAVLNGGIQAWQASGGGLKSGPAAVRPAHFMARAPLTEPLDTVDVIDALGQERLLLLDVRAPERYRGDFEPIDPVAGHIPGAINRPFSDNLDADGCFLPPEQLRAQYQELADSGKQLVSMCGSGITACHTLLALEHAGLGGAKLYAGSWSEWIRDPSLPIATGDS